MANYTTTITNEGAALLASVIANQGTLTFNEFRFSENDYTGQESTLTEGTFLGVFITASAAASVIDLTTIKASAQFNNSTITGNHNLYSIGIVGTDGNTTALIAVCTTSDPDVIREPLTGTSTYAFNVNLTVSNTNDITVVGTTAAVIYDIDVVDTLISTATDKPLSANMGRVLKGNIDDNFSGQSNRNFVDNPFFTINQRGATTVTSGYGADRWFLGGGDVGSNIVFAQGSATLTNVQMQQYFEKQIPNGTYTLSVKKSDGTIYKGTINKTDDVSLFDAVNNEDVYVGYNAQYKMFVISTYGKNTNTFVGTKLEPGSVSTLHLDTEPNYTTEYLKCRRYFKRFKGEFGIGCVREYATSPINFLFRIKIPNDVPMRSDSPSVVVNGDIRIPDYAGVYTSSDLINVSGAKNSSVINMDIYSNSTLPAQPMAKGMAANVDVYIFGPNDGTLDLVDEL